MAALLRRKAGLLLGRPTLSLGVKTVGGNLRYASTLGTLHTAPGTPSPDTVHMYMHEAGIADAVAIEKVNIGKASNRSAEFQALNPMGEVPALVTDDGVVTESLVMCVERTSNLVAVKHCRERLVAHMPTLTCPCMNFVFSVWQLPLPRRRAHRVRRRAGLEPRPSLQASTSYADGLLPTLFAAAAPSQRQGLIPSWRDVPRPRHDRHVVRTRRDQVSRAALLVGALRPARQVFRRPHARLHPSRDRRAYECGCQGGHGVARRATGCRRPPVPLR